MPPKGMTMIADVVTGKLDVRAAAVDSLTAN